MAARTLRILVCPNAFKGSLTAEEAARAIAEGLQAAAAEARDWRVETVCLPLADGGDGTLATLVAATEGEILRQTVSDPLGRPIEAAWGRLGGEQRGTAVIEMAEASGLRLLRSEERDPLHASTFGTGELMRAALDAGCRTLLVGIGGSATNDGGMGMATVLGARFLDAGGNELPSGGAALARLAQVDMSGWCFPEDATVLVACDVDNPLCGPEGTAAIYGPQKGATPDMVRELDAALAHYADMLREQLGVDVKEIPGAGAAGGLGAGLMAFCRATLRPGTEMALDATGFDRHLRTCQLVITGEGRLDGQTARGKVVSGVVKRAAAAGVPTLALAGGVAEDAEVRLREVGLTAAFSIVEGPCTVEEAMRDGYRLLAGSATRVLGCLMLDFDLPELR